ncbi:hypothetical protein CD351_14405 [Erythrobacter sp. KY5]|uniref:response regulator n=1 Tax=Erythrobacter sp. KY5 TaxID=2011159 RepID=UPI000DBF0625|nr:response regulator [Erythrobacter sp. KY5]AWW75625.1 hypothetical protein CD351_14405 [Erythrobacter sp. KY5]
MHLSNAVILVVEDEVLIRMDVVDQLSAEGYVALEASSGREALSALADAEKVDVLFTDIDMPGDTDGVMLANEVSQTWPGIGIIVTSGKASPDPGSLPQGSRFCTKPYSPSAVHAAIQEILAKPD